MIFLLRIVGAVLVILAGTAAGCLQSRKLLHRKEQLRRFLTFLETARAEISYAALSVEEILSRYGRGLDFLVPYFVARNNGEPFAKAWEKAIHVPFLNREDRALISGFGEGFGTTDTQGQISHCNLYMEFTRAQLQSADEACARKCRLYQILGACGGAVAALLLAA